MDPVCLDLWIITGVGSYLSSRFPHTYDEYVHQFSEVVLRVCSISFSNYSCFDGHVRTGCAVLQYQQSVIYTAVCTAVVYSHSYVHTFIHSYISDQVHSYTCGVILRTTCGTAVRRVLVLLALWHSCHPGESPRYLCILHEVLPLRVIRRYARPRYYCVPGIMLLHTACEDGRVLNSRSRSFYDVYSYFTRYCFTEHPLLLTCVLKGDSPLFAPIVPRVLAHAMYSVGARRTGAWVTHATYLAPGKSAADRSNSCVYP